MHRRDEEGAAGAAVSPHRAGRGKVSLHGAELIWQGQQEVLGRSMPGVLLCVPVARKVQGDVHQQLPHSRRCRPGEEIQNRWDTWTQCSVLTLL